MPRVRNEEQAPEAQAQPSNGTMLDAELVTALSHVADRLEETFGFRPTLTQTVMHLIVKART